MTTVSIGDMAQLFLLRRSNAETSRQIDGLTADLARGTASDVGRHLRGQISPLAAIETALSRASAYEIAADQGATRAAAMQAALGRFSSAAESNTSTLLRAAQSGDVNSLAIAARDARAALDDAVLALNTRFSDRSLFSGATTDRSPLPDASALLAAAKAAIGAATTPGDAAVALDDWLSDPAGFAAQVYGGSAEAADIPIATDEVVRLDVTAADPALRDTFKGLILGALMSEPGFEDPSSRGVLARMAGNTLLTAADDRIALAARIGTVEARFAQAQSRQAGEQVVLAQARSDLVAVDGYDVATRLEEARSRLEMIYNLTARLSRLSLADYL